MKKKIRLKPRKIVEPEGNVLSVDDLYDTELTSIYSRFTDVDFKLGQLDFKLDQLIAELRRLKLSHNPT